MPIGERFHISPEGLHGTCQNVSFYLSFFFFTEGLQRTCRNVCLWEDFSTFERKGCTERVGTYHFMIFVFQNVGGTYAERIRNVSEREQSLCLIFC